MVPKEFSNPQAPADNLITRRMYNSQKDVLQPEGLDPGLAAGVLVGTPIGGTTNPDVCDWLVSVWDVFGRP
jgi:hypothetical protein